MLGIGNLPISVSKLGEDVKLSAVTVSSGLQGLGSDIRAGLVSVSSGVRATGAFIFLGAVAIAFALIVATNRLIEALE